jgi:hypothetical protein
MENEGDEEQTVYRGTNYWVSQTSQFAHFNQNGLGHSKAITCF